MAPENDVDRRNPSVTASTEAQDEGQTHKKEIPSEKSSPPSFWWKMSGATFVTWVVLSGFGVVQVFWGNYLVDSWGRNFRYYQPYTATENTPEIDDDRLTSYLNQYSEFKPEVKNRIEEQVLTIRNRAKTHARIVRDLYLFSITVIAVGAVSSISGAFCLLHISRRGWDNANPLIIGIFTTSLGYFVVCSSCILIYQYERNIQIHGKLYVNYINLEDKLLTELANGFTLETDNDGQRKPINLKETSITLHKTLVELNSIDISIDWQGIPGLDEVLKQIDTNKDKSKTPY